MLVVMVRIPVGSQEEGSRMEERFRNRAGMVDNMPGFMSFELLKGDSEIISVTRWATQADLDRWMQSQANAQAHAAVSPPTGGGHPGAENAKPVTTQGAGGSHEQASSQGSDGVGQGAARPQGSVMVYEVVIPEAGRD